MYGVNAPSPVNGGDARSLAPRSDAEKYDPRGHFDSSLGAYAGRRCVAGLERGTGGELKSIVGVPPNGEGGGADDACRSLRQESRRDVEENERHDGGSRLHTNMGRERLGGRHDPEGNDCTVERIEKNRETAGRCTPPGAVAATGSQTKGAGATAWRCQNGGGPRVADGQATPIRPGIWVDQCVESESGIAKIPGDQSMPA
jgi:hypothetical protein